MLIIIQSYYLLLCLSLAVLGTSFQLHSANIKRLSTNTRHSSNLLFMYEKHTEKPSPSVIPEYESPTTGLNSIDRFVSPDTDVPSILTILMGQTGLIIGVILLEIFTGFGITPPGGSFTFSPQALSLVGAISIPLFLADLAFKNIGWQFAKEVERNSGVFTLRLLGRSTHSVAAAFTTLLLSVASAFSEEIFFRGYSINVIQAYSDVTTAAIATSIIYGLAHFPFTFGATAIFEGVLGAFYAFAFYYSGFNLAVPILLHLLYDFSTLFVTWYNASRDLNRNLAIAEKIRLLPSEDPKRFDEMCKVVFDMLDINKDGKVDKIEFILSQRLMGIGPFYYKSDLEETENLLGKYDKNNDGKMDFNEFRVLLEKGMKKSA